MKNSRENSKTKKTSFKMPHTYVILLAIAVIVAILTWIIPAGQFERVFDEELERTLLVPDSFEYVEQTPVGFFQFFTLIQEAMIDAADIIFFIFFAYTFVYMEMKCGAFDAAIGALLRRLEGRDRFLIPILMLCFGIAGSTFGMIEETYALLPAMMGLAIALNYDALVGGALVYIGVGTGFASATFNPFTIGVAQSIAEVPLFSGLAFRVVVFIVFMGTSIWYVTRYAKKVRKNPEHSIVKDVDFGFIEGKTGEELLNTKFIARHKISMLMFVITIVLIMIGAIKFDWYINEIAALFIIMTIVVGLIQGYSLSQIAETFLEAVRGVAFGAIVVGMARVILVIMDEGNIIDTVIYSMANLAKTGSKYVSSIVMLIVQNVLNFFIPSGSGQASVSMPIMAPLADMVGLTRQVSVLAFQFGDGYSNMFWPTSVAAWCGLMGLPIDKWYKFMTPLAIILFVLQVVFIIIATAINLGPF